MRRLLSANLSRLWKDKAFLIGVVSMLLVSALMMLSGYRQAVTGAETGRIYYFDDYYFNTAPLVGMFLSFVLSWFLGTEYSDGTIRNKIVVGHSRSAIYLANLITSIVVSAALVAVWLIGGLVGLAFLAPPQMPLPGLLLYSLIAFCFCAAQSAIFTLIGQLSSNKAATIVISVLVFFALLIGASMVYNRLCEPELYSGIVMTDGGIQMGEPAPNPSYLSGAIRTVYETLLNILPTGQAILMANGEIARPWLQIGSSVAIVVLVSVCGLVVFRKKDLK